MVTAVLFKMNLKDNAITHHLHVPSVSGNQLWDTLCDYPFLILGTELQPAPHEFMQLKYH